MFLEEKQEKMNPRNIVIEDKKAFKKDSNMTKKNNIKDSTF